MLPHRACYITTGEMFDSDRLLFILGNPGAGAHRFGRIVSCFDNVYWYTHADNGIGPCDVFNNAIIAGKDISGYHYDRLVDSKPIPALGERIERWWFDTDIDRYYETRWLPAMQDPAFDIIPDTQYIHWVLHDTPKSLRARFPNARMIALIDQDLEAVTDRYLATTAQFPVSLKFPGLKPEYLNDHARAVKELEQTNPGPTIQYLWNKLNPGSASGYRTATLNQLSVENDLRATHSDCNYITATWNNLDIDALGEFLGADSIDSAYKQLLK